MDGVGLGRMRLRKIMVVGTDGKEMLEGRGSKRLMGVGVGFGGLRNAFMCYD